MLGCYRCYRLVVDGVSVRSECHVYTQRRGDSCSYRYDGLGRRIEKNTNGNITQYYYDNEDIILEVDESQNIFAHYTHGPGIDEPLIMDRGGESYYYLADGLGSVTTITDSNQNIINSYTYDSFGNIIEQTGSLKNPFTYTAREYDTESGLYYYRARYFNPRIGRFLQEDPLWDVNLYAYVNNNPVNWIDPWGLCGEKKKLSWWEWWLYESALPGSYYGQPMSEWGPSGPTGGFSLMKYTEEAGGAWMWAERAALGISAGAALTAGGLMATGAAGIKTKVALDAAHHTFRLGRWAARLRHIQVTVWRAGVKASHKILRLPLPWK